MKQAFKKWRDAQCDYQMAQAEFQAALNAEAIRMSPHAVGDVIQYDESESLYTITRIIGTFTDYRHGACSPVHYAKRHKLSGELYKNEVRIYVSCHHYNGS